MKLRIWHISNPPRNGFKKEVQTVEEAKKILALLAEYDLWLGDLIHSNASGLEVYNEETKEWEEWYNEETGEDIWHEMDEIENQLAEGINE